MSKFLSEVKLKHLKKGKVFWTFNPITKNLVSFKLLEDIRYDYDLTKIYDSEGFYTHEKPWLKVDILHFENKNDLYGSVITSTHDEKFPNYSVIYPSDCIITNCSATIHFTRRMAKKYLNKKVLKNE
jgi:hypothetical protein